MQVYKYLIKIKAGELINFDSFSTKLQQHGFNNHRILKAFLTEKKAKSKYVVKIVDKEFFSQLELDFPPYIVNDRVSAAISGDSHKHPVSKSIVILWPCKQSHPVVVLNDSKEIKTPVTLSNKLLIIENQENFIQLNKTLDFLKNQFHDFSCEDLDIAHGSGNAISNTLNKDFFNAYKSIDCLLDIDIGGLTTFANISFLTCHKNINFLLPPCASILLKKSRIALKNEQLSELRSFHENFPSLRPAVELIVKHKKMLEQELYLED